jgi:hypothetical protein
VRALKRMKAAVSTKVGRHAMPPSLS